DSRVAEYTKAIDGGGLFGENHAGSPAKILREIDTAIIKAYNLPMSLERQLLNYFHGSASERPVSVAAGTYTASELDVTYGSIKNSLELPGVGPTESWERLQLKLDEDRLSSRKLFS